MKASWLHPHPAITLSLVSLTVGIAYTSLQGKVLGRASWRPSTSAGRAALVTFEDATQQAGIHFRHQNGAAGKKYMPESVGSGCAFLDYDGDGWLDVLLVGGTHWPENPAPQGSSLALYRNNRNGTFTDVTRSAGLELHVYGMGVSAADFDNDGDTDLFITCLGPNHLFRNNGNGTFTDVTRAAGVAGAPVEPGGLRWKWSASAAWFDYDRDGWLDLFVTQYVRWTPQTDLWCGREKRKGYCPPDRYEGVPCTLYHSNRDGTFTDVSRATGVLSHAGKSFGVVADDFDGDGWPDLAVTNDGVPNFLFHNVRGRRFEERAAETGFAVSNSGASKAGMGVDIADWSNSGRMGLLVGNFTGQSLSLFENDGRGYFDEVASRARVAEPSLLDVTFGLFFFDADLDGWKDAFCANGNIDDLADTPTDPVHYRQRPLLFLNRRDGTFEEAGMRAGPPMRRPLVARGCAAGDFDRDGDLDILVIDNGSPALLLRNTTAAGHWLRVKLVGSRSNRDGIGSRIRLTAGGLTRTEVVRTGCSFLSQSDLRPTFGLGREKRVDALEVRWPSGAVTYLPDLPPDQELVIPESGS